MIKRFLENDEDPKNIGKPVSGEAGDTPPKVVRIFGMLDEENEDRAPNTAAPFDLSEIDPTFRDSNKTDDAKAGSPAEPLTKDEEPPVLTAYSPPTTDETVRMSGLAWTAGIVLFASIGFMLLVGWLFDLLLGSSPWGIVGGIVIGSIIGFVQFFRINSEILRIPKHKPAVGFIPHQAAKTEAAPPRPEFLDKDTGTD